MKTILLSLAVVSTLAGAAFAGEDHGANFRASFGAADAVSSTQVRALAVQPAKPLSSFQLFVQQIENGERGGNNR